MSAHPAVGSAGDTKRILLQEERKESLEERVQRLELENEKLRNQRGLSGAAASPYPDAMEAMSARLAEIRFPTEKTEYDLPYLILPESNPYAREVQEGRIVEDWQRRGCPDFLLTRLEEKVVKLTEFRWDRQQRRLSRGSFEPGKAEVNLKSEAGGNFYALVSASGTGKSRFLFEEANETFGVYLVTHLLSSQPGISDLSTFLDQLPVRLSEENKDRVCDQLRERMIRVILARIAVFRRAQEATPDLEPRHWLALQLFPGRFTGGREVFTEAIQAAASFSVSSDALTVEWSRAKQTLRFISIDEAQHADKLYKNMFENADNSTRRSVLSVLVSVISGLSTNIVLSGTGLGIESSIELLVSSAAKQGVSAKLIGTTTFFDEGALLTAVKSRGYLGSIEKDDLKLFTGRPRFGMRFAEALLLNKPIADEAAEIVQGFKNKLQELQQTPSGASNVVAKSLYGELRFAAMEWILRGKDSVLRYGDVALELGVCALTTKSKIDNRDSTPFTLREPLVIRAFTNLPKADFESLTNESAALIGHLFEDYIALNASHVIEGIMSLAKDQISKSPEFKGPWQLAIPAGDERLGIGSQDGEEYKHIQRILDCAGGKGPSIVFPGTSLGADLIIAAKHKENDRRLLVFIQVKACMKVSTTAAMDSLKYPYHQNRDKPYREVPSNKLEAFKNFNGVVNVPTVSVVHVVVKYPADSKRRSQRSRLDGRILRVVFDKSTAEKNLQPLSIGLKGMMSIKSTASFKELFIDG